MERVDKYVTKRLEHVEARSFCLPCWHHGGVKRRPSMLFCEDVPTHTRFAMPAKEDWGHEPR